MNDSADSRSPAGQQSTLRGIVSLLIVLHLLVVGASLLCSVQRSELQTRLKGKLATYSRSLYFAPVDNPYLYTYGNTLFGDIDDDDHLVLIEISANAETNSPARTISFPPAGSNWSPDRRRGFLLTHQLGWFAEEEADDPCGILVQELAWQQMRRFQVDEADVRCVRRLTQPLNLEDLRADFPRDNPAAPKYDRDVYAAQVFLVDGKLQVAKKSATLEVAPRKNDAGGADGK